MNTGALLACTLIELSQKLSPACSAPNLTFHSSKYTALSDRKNYMNRNRLIKTVTTIVYTIKTQNFTFNPAGKILIKYYPCHTQNGKKHHKIFLVKFAQNATKETY